MAMARCPLRRPPREPPNREDEAVKYMLLIISNDDSWAALSHAERVQLGDDHAALAKELTESGVLVHSGALSDMANTRTVRVRGGVANTTDGPFAETKEHLAGFYVVECATQERAIELTKRFPSARSGPIELRPLAGPNGEDI